jgi:hypothetical protein
MGGKCHGVEFTYRGEDKRGPEIARILEETSLHVYEGEARRGVSTTSTTMDLGCLLKDLMKRVKELEEG